RGECRAPRRIPCRRRPSPSATRLPTGSSPGQQRRARVSLTTAPQDAEPVSVSSNSLPEMSGVCIAAHTRGETRKYAAVLVNGGADDAPAGRAGGGGRGRGVRGAV